MNSRTADRILSKTFGEPLAYMGFRQIKQLNPLLFVQGPSEILQTLQFAGRIDAHYHFQFGFYVGVRFLALEKILRPELLEKFASTVMLRMHLLREDTSYTEWTLEDSSPPLDLTHEILKEVERYGFPYWAKYSNLDNLRVALVSADPTSRCYAFGPEQRLATLAAIEFVQGRVAQALEMLDQAIEKERKSPVPAARLYFERVRRRICATQAEQTAANHTSR